MQNVQYDYFDSRYQELAILGNEEKKSTYLAKDIVSGRIVVKKYIQAANASIYEQISTIKSPHMARIFHVAGKDKNALVIMEYVSGRTIAEWQKEISVFSEKETIDYISQLLRGLAEIHKCGIIHRDINPRNILISVDGVVKLLDFDIGRQYKDTQGSDTTVLGTVGYAAPEQFGFTQSDERTDIYAIGVLMNVMLTGRLPKEQMYECGRLGDMIATCTQIAPEKRYQTVEEMIQEMEALDVFSKQKKTIPVTEENIIPGFRTGQQWKKVVACTYYILMGIYSVGCIVECFVTPLAAILEIVAVVMYIWLTVFLPLNFLDWMSKVPITKRLKRTGRIVLGVILWMLLFYFGYALEQYVRADILHIAVSTTK